MSTANYNQYFTEGVMTGFTTITPIIKAFSYTPSDPGAAFGDHIRVPFASAATSSSDFTYTGGYSGNNGQVQIKDCTLNILKYQPLQLTDADMKVMSPAVLIQQGIVLGKKLASDFVSASFASVISSGNYTTTASYTGGQFSSSTAMAAIDQQANVANWPDGERYLIGGTTLWNGLMNNTQVINAYALGGVEAVQNGRIPSFFGFKPFKTSITLPNSDTGFIAHPNAMVIANVYHQPADASKGLVTAERIDDEGTGLSIGYREWYDPTHATTNRIYDVLGGVVVGDATALIHIK